MHDSFFLYEQQITMRISIGIQQNSFSMRCTKSNTPGIVDDIDSIKLQDNLNDSKNLAIFSKVTHCSTNLHQPANSTNQCCKQ